MGCVVFLITRNNWCLMHWKLVSLVISIILFKVFFRCMSMEFLGIVFRIIFRIFGRCSDIGGSVVILKDETISSFMSFDVRHLPIFRGSIPI